MRKKNPLWWFICQKSELSHPSAVSLILAILHSGNIIIDNFKYFVSRFRFILPVMLKRRKVKSVLSQILMQNS